MEQMMLQSDIGKIAQEVSQYLDIESMLDSDSDNPMEVFQKLMSGDGLGKIMNTIHTTCLRKWIPVKLIKRLWFNKPNQCIKVWDKIRCFKRYL